MEISVPVFEMEAGAGRAMLMVGRVMLSGKRCFVSREEALGEGGRRGIYECWKQAIGK